VVFCSSLTFVASANPILYQGATPVLIDSEMETWNMSPEALERALQDAKENGKLPKAVIVVNLYGKSAKMDELVSICDAYGRGSRITWQYV
jgi:pyridoxal phosphate-dependent aminotransferase EpsN